MSNTDLNMLIEKLHVPGVTIKKRDQEQYMEESIEKRAAYIAKKEQVTRDTGVVSEAEAMERFYEKGNKVD